MPLLAAVRAVDITSKSEQVQEGLTQKIAELLSFFFGNLPSWIAGVIVFFLSVVLARMAKKTMENRLAEHMDETENEAVMVLAGRVAYVGVLTVGTTIALKIAGIDLTTILAAVAFGIGFALRDLIMNFLAGVLIIVSKQFVIGDFINVDGQVGKVQEIQSRATILKATNGTKIVVPNSLIFTSPVTNYTANPMRRVDIPLYVAYGTDLDYAIRVTLDAVKSHPKVLIKPKPSVRIMDWGDSSIDMKTRFWVTRDDGWFKVRHDMMNILSKAFAEAGIHVPYNILHVETNPDTAAEETEEVKAIEKKKAAYEIAERAKKAQEQSAIQTTTTVAQPAAQAEPPPVAASGNGNGNGAGVLPLQVAQATVPVQTSQESQQ